MGDVLVSTNSTEAAGKLKKVIKGKSKFYDKVTKSQGKKRSLEELEIELRKKICLLNDMMVEIHKRRKRAGQPSS